jgi:hypothetical protein
MIHDLDFERKKERKIVIVSNNEFKHEIFL